MSFLLVKTNQPETMVKNQLPDDRQTNLKPPIITQWSVATQCYKFIDASDYCAFLFAGQYLFQTYYFPQCSHSSTPPGYGTLQCGLQPVKVKAAVFTLNNDDNVEIVEVMASGICSLVDPSIA